MIGGLLALSLVLTGTGYAYWTDTLNVTTKASTGDLDVTFADLGLYAQYGNETLKGGWSIVDGIGESGYVDDSFFMRGSSNYNIIAKPGSIEEYKKRQRGYAATDFDAKLVDADWVKRDGATYNHANTKGSDKIEIKINEMYPGYAQAFRSDILNVGSIAARLSGLKFTIEGEKDGVAEDMLGVAMLVQGELYSPKDMAFDDQVVFRLVKELGLSAEDYFTVGGVDFVRLSALKKLDPAVVRVAVENANILCSPATDNRMDLFLGIAMDPDANGRYTTGSTKDLKDNNDALSQNKGVTVGIDFLWDQFNEGKDAGNPNLLHLQNK